MKNKGTIVIADDRENNRNCIGWWVEDYFSEHPIIYCDDGRALYDVLSRNRDGISLVITDNEMPGRHGVDIIRDYSGKGIPFILCSSDGNLEKDASSNGALFVKKPFSGEEIVLAISQALKFREVH